MNYTKVEDLERLHKLYVAGAITETEFKILKKEIMGEVSDVIDDKVYRSVKIGKQEWMVDNLNVDHFRNGDIIPEARTVEEWERAGKEKRPAWCYLGNNSSNGEKYGKLYNWYAINDPRGLAPEGWHVPTDAEWTVLEDFLTANGHSRKEGTALKATSGWCDPEGKLLSGTDDYGWNGLPGGNRFFDRNFLNVGYGGCWWSSSQHKWSADSAWTRRLYNTLDGVYSIICYKKYGFSVRCLRD